MDARVVGKPRRGGNGRSLTLPPICRALWNAKLRIGACGTIYELAGAVPGAPGAAGGGAGSEPDGPTTSHPPSQNHGATGKRPAGGFPNLYILGVDIWPAVGEDGRHEDESVRGGGRAAESLPPSPRPWRDKPARSPSGRAWGTAAGDSRAPAVGRAVQGVGHQGPLGFVGLC